MDTPDMRWEPENLSVVGDGTLIWLTQKALWFSKNNKEWQSAAFSCSEETVKRINNGGSSNLLIPFLIPDNSGQDNAKKVAWLTNSYILEARKKQKG